MAAAVILNCWICKILLADGVWRGNTITIPNFVKIGFLLRRYCNFSNFQDGRRRHLGFLKSRYFIDYCIQRVETHLRAKFCQNQSIGCEDIKNFRFFKMAAAVILNCWICKILLADGVWRGNTITVPNFVKIGFLLRRYCNFSNFQDGRRRHLGFLNSRYFIDYWIQRVETHLRAKFCQNRSITCEDIKIFRFFKMAADAI